MSDLWQTPVEPPVLEELNQMLQRAKQGDEAVLPQLRQLLDSRPELWRHFGDLAMHAQEAWLRLIAGPDLVLREATARKAQELRDELGGAHPSAIERLLVDRTVLTWMQLNHAEVSASQAITGSIRMSDFWLKRQNAAHRRFIMSLAALTTVRRLFPASQGTGLLDEEALAPEHLLEVWPQPRPPNAGLS